MLQATLQFGRQDKKEEECLFKKTTDYYYFMCDEILPPFNFSLLIPYIKKTKQTSKKKKPKQKNKTKTTKKPTTPIPEKVV